MPADLLVRFRPVGPWRPGSENGARDRTDRVFHSDSLYSAVTIAMRDLGWLDDWLAATTSNGDPAIRLSSCYPYSGRILFVPPPRGLWPVSQNGKVRWQAARFVPVSLIPALLREEDLKDDQWVVDPVSECLLPVMKHGPASAPFRIARRSFAPVDRLTGASESSRSLACLQFAQGAGMWFAARFASDDVRDVWQPRLRSAARLLADTGIGGGRSRGWGRSEEPRFETLDMSQMLTGAPVADASGTAWWLLSLYSPADNDSVDWKRGNYDVCVRAGRTEIPANWGDLKPALRMVSEGSVLLSGSSPAGVARALPSAEIPHPVYRSGIALAVQIPWKASRRMPWTMEETIVPQAETMQDVPGEEPVREPPQQEPTGEAPPEQDPPVEEPPVTEPPEVDPVPAEPPVQEPPGEAPPVTGEAETTEGQPS